MCTVPRWSDEILPSLHPIAVRISPLSVGRVLAYPLQFGLVLAALALLGAFDGAGGQLLVAVVRIERIFVGRLSYRATNRRWRTGEGKGQRRNDRARRRGRRKRGNGSRLLSHATLAPGMEGFHVFFVLRLSECGGSAERAVVVAARGGLALERSSSLLLLLPQRALLQPGLLPGALLLVLVLVLSLVVGGPRRAAAPWGTGPRFFHSPPFLPRALSFPSSSSLRYIAYPGTLALPALLSGSPSTHVCDAAVEPHGDTVPDIDAAAGRNDGIPAAKGSAAGSMRGVTRRAEKEIGESGADVLCGEFPLDGRVDDDCEAAPECTADDGCEFRAL